MLKGSIILKEFIESATTTESGNEFQALIIRLQKENVLNNRFERVPRVRLSRFKVKVGKVFTSYKLLRILCISSKSPRKCRYFKVGNCRPNLSAPHLDSPLEPRISLV